MKSLPNTIHKTVVAEEINAAHGLLRKIEKFGVVAVAEAENGARRVCGNSSAVRKREKHCSTGVT